MKNYFRSFTINFLVAGFSVLLGCSNSNTSSKAMSKADSISFAKAVFDLYKPDTSISAKIRTESNVRQVKFSTKSWAPISWSTVLDYSGDYDLAPLIFSGGIPVKGLMINETGLSALRALPSTRKRIYLRFGKNKDGEYTVMVLPIDASGRVTKSDNANFDHLDPCPIFCPSNFDN